MLPLKNSDTNLSDLRRKIASIIPLNSKSSRNPAIDFLICNAVLVVCTFIGIFFRWFGFSDATIISVYILGVLLSAVLVTGYLINFIVSFEAMIVFNFFFTEPLFTLHAYDAEYPVTFNADRISYRGLDRGKTQGKRCTVRSDVRAHKASV